ncbi:MAG: hypothetical protein R2800_15010 [Flavipsychrobacter sp.]
MSIVYFLFSLLPLLLSIFAVAILYFLLLQLGKSSYPLTKLRSSPALTQKRLQLISRAVAGYLLLFLLSFIVYCFRNSFYTFFDVGILWVFVHFLFSVPVLLLLRYQEKELTYRITKLLFEFLFGFLIMQAAIRTSEQWF